MNILEAIVQISKFSMVSTVTWDQFGGVSSIMPQMGYGSCCSSKPGEQREDWEALGVTMGSATLQGLQGLPEQQSYSFRPPQQSKDQRDFGSKLRGRQKVGGDALPKLPYQAGARANKQILTFGFPGQGPCRAVSVLYCTPRATAVNSCFSFKGSPELP